MAGQIETLAGLADVEALAGSRALGGGLVVRGAAAARRA